MRPEIGIVGYGRCGQLAAEVLENDFQVVVTDARDLSSDAAARGVAWGDLAACASRPTVLLAVPVRAMPGVLRTTAPHLRSGSTVVDMASVKVRPLEWMAEFLPPGVARVGTHPLFGPDSVPDRNVRGERIVVRAEPHVGRHRRALRGHPTAQPLRFGARPRPCRRRAARGGAPDRRPEPSLRYRGWVCSLASPASSKRSMSCAI